MSAAGLRLTRPLRGDVQHAGRMVCAVTLGLVALGLVMVYSSTAAVSARASGTLDILSTASTRYADPTAALLRQLRWVLIAAVAGYVAYRLPLEWLRRLARPAMLITLVMLALVLIIGPDRNHSRRWIVFAGMSVQPSEFFKVAILLHLSTHLAARERASAFGHGAPLLQVLFPVGVGVALVLVAPDLGTSLFLVAEAVVLLGLAGVRPSRFVPAALIALPALMFYGWRRFGHVRERIRLFTAPPEAGSQIQESLVAVGSGGLVGRGLGEGTQKLGYVAEQKTDFIFSVIGEELGFLGAAGVVIAFMVFIWYGRKVAWEARVLGPQAFYLAAGATFIVSFQALVNIAVVTASAPTKGVSLPFISVGGSNLLMAGICVGLIANVSRRTAEEVAGDLW